MCISKETLEGLRFTGNVNQLKQHCFIKIIIITVKAFVELARYLLSLPGVKYFLSEKINQDTVECFFGRQRMRGGYSDNPNIKAFIYGSNSLRVQGSAAVKVMRGNCRGKENTQGRHNCMHYS